MDFRGKNVLVAGGNGLIGTPLHRMLIEEEDANVRIVSLGDKSHVHPKADFYELDLTKFGNCLVACSGMDYAFNLLCLKGSPKFMKENPATAFDTNVDLEMNMLRAAHQCGVKGYLLTSSIGIYPPADVFFEDNAVNEKFPSKNDRFAGGAKFFAEIQAQAYQIQYTDIKISIVRPANTYGPLDDFETEKAMVVPSFIRRVLSGENPFIVYGVSQIRDVIYCEDVAKGMIHMAKLEETRPINLGSGEAYTLFKILNVVLDNLDIRPKVIYEKSGSLGDIRRVLDISRAKSLGWSPKVSLEEGIKRTMEWYLENQKLKIKN